LSVRLCRLGLNRTDRRQIVTDIKIGGTFATGRSRERSEPLQFGDATGAGTPVFDAVTSVKHPEFGEVTFLPGEAKPAWLIEQQVWELSTQPTPEHPWKGKGNRPVTGSGTA